MLVIGTAFAACADQTADSAATTVVLPERIDDWTRQDAPVEYDRETIFDYIDGAGEVYRSYAFADVQVAHYSRAGHPDISVELFDMGTPADAYGVFSYTREQEEAGIGGGYELSGSVLCFWQNRYYLCIAAAERTDGVDTTLVSVARTLAGLLPAGSERPALLDVLPATGRVAFSERYFHTYESLNYHYYVAPENLLNLNAETDAVLARYQPGSTYLLVVAYRRADDAARALASFRRGYVPQDTGSAPANTDRGFVSSHQQDRFLIGVLDAVTEEAATHLVQETVQRLAR